MNLFSNDADIAVFEPELFAETSFAGQVRAKGTNGVVDGTSFSAAGGDFINKNVTAGDMIYLQSLDGAIDAAYEIVSVDSATVLTISAIRGSDGTTPIAVGTASSLIYRVLTFEPQAARAVIEITGRLGIRPGAAGDEYGLEDIVDADPLRLPSVYRVLAMIYGKLGGTEDEKKTYTQKRDQYMALYQKAFERIQLTLDADDDGIVDKVIRGDSVKAIRR